MLSVLKSLTIRQKRVILLALDAVLVILSVACAFVLRDLPGGVLPNLVRYAPVLSYILIMMVVFSTWLGVCAVSLNAFDKTAIGITAMLALILASTSFLGSVILGLNLPIGLHVMFAASVFSLVVLSRGVLLHIVLTIYRKGTARCRVLIYGAGTTGAQLVLALRGHESIEPIAFVDDNVALQGVRIAHLSVHSPMKLAELVEERKIDRVLLAVPSLSKPKQAQLARRLEKMGLEVQTLPSFAQLIGGEALVDNLTPLSPHRFLSRDEVTSGLDENATCYLGKVVMVSGAGGTIGSEICRQVLQSRPTKVVLFELTEFALYTADMELQQLVEGTEIKVVSVLGSITEPRLVRKVLTTHGVNVILHAAAYKHVSLVEANPLAGLANNVLGTQILAEQAIQAGVERFLLISSDKAVRPTNVMGGSKRLAELVIQNMARKHGRGGGTVFSMVRFGNVSGSGSVVPLFQEQLSHGGPLTVTDRSVTRYFMPLQEAVQLVLQADGLAQGGEIFVLDMGKPVPIIKLAQQMIEAAGYTLQDDENPDGDIRIEITSLRPGEKMTEELTLDSALIGTRHPKIFVAHKDERAEIEISSALRGLREALIAEDEEMARDVVRRWVER